MEPSIWEMQQAAQRRVQRMEQLSRRYAQTGNGTPFSDRRPAASAWAHRPPPSIPVTPRYAPPLRGDPPSETAKKHLDREQLFLLLLTLFLAKNGGSPTLILARLYLSF